MKVGEISRLHLLYYVVALWAKICLQHIFEAEGVNGEVFAGRQATKAKVNAHSQ